MFLMILTSCQVKKGSNEAGGLFEGHQNVPISVSLDMPAPINIANQSNYSLAGNCSNNDEDVTLVVGAQTLTATCTNKRFEFNSLDLSSEADTLTLSLNVTHLTKFVTRNVRKDTIAPTLVSTFISPGARSIGDTIFIQVSFDEEVTYLLVPRIELSFNTQILSPPYAQIISGAGFSTLNFVYVTLPGDGDGNGIDLVSTIDLNGGAITDLAGNPAPLALTTTNFPAVTIGASGVPSVSVGSPLNNSFINIVSNTASFPISGSCDEGGATVSIEIDGSPAASPSGFLCDGSTYSGTIDVTGLSEAPHTLVAKLTGAGGTGTSGTINITKDITAPTLTLDPPTNVNSANAATYSLSGDCSENGQNVTVNFGSLLTTASCAAGSWTLSSWDVSAEPDNATVSITADHSDAAGNPATQASGSVGKDTSAPTITITSPLDNSYINIASNSANFVISGVCSEAAATVLIKVDGSSASSPSGFVCDGANFTGTIDVTALSEASHAFIAEISDGTNTGTSSTVNITKDVTAPSVTLNAPLNVITTNVSSYSLSGTCSENTQSISVSFGALSNSTVCGAGSWSISGWNVSGQADNASVSVTTDHSDAAGNLATQATASVIKDTVAPTVAITFSPDITSANQASYQISGSCSENGSSLSVDIGSLNFTPSCSSNAWVVGPTDVSSVPDSPSLAISASQTDVNGNVGSDSVTVDKTTIGATVTIASAPNITQANKTNYSISGTCSENGTNVSLMIGSISKTASCASGNWNSGVVDVSSLADGNVTITADHATATQASTTVTKDTTAPTVTISSAPDINQSNQSSYQVTGTCSQNGVAVSVFIDSLNFTPNCTSGAWSTGFQDVSSIPDGTGISVTADHSTATQAQVFINKATSTPTVSSLSVATTLPTSIDLNWNLVDPGGFTINDYIIHYRVKGSPTWLLFSDGVSVSTSTTVTGLSSSTTYEFRVAVVYDTSNQSGWSNIAEGTTQPNSPLFGPNVAMNVGGSTDTTVVAHEDGTNVTLNGSPLVTLNRGQTHRFTSAAFDLIDADKPIFTAGRRGSGSAVNTANIVWSPTSWAGKRFSFNANRESLQMVHVYAVEATNVEVRLGNTLLDSASLAAGGTTTLSWSTLGSYQIQATGTILAFHISGDGGSRLIDPKPLLPDSFEIIGFPSNSMQLTTGTDGTNYTALHSNSVQASGSLNKNDVVSISPQGSPTSLYQGESLLLSADQKIFGASYADSNGNCAAPFLPTNLMKSKYALPVAGDYIAFASKSAGSIEVRDAANTLITTLTLARSGANSNAPYKVRYANPAAGLRFIANTPVAAWYQPNSNNGGADQDETVMYGSN